MSAFLGGPHRWPHIWKSSIHVLCELKIMWIEKFIWLNNQHLLKSSLQTGPGIQEIKNARQRINKGGSEGISLCNYMLWLFYQKTNPKNIQNQNIPRISCIFFYLWFSLFLIEIVYVALLLLFIYYYYFIFPEKHIFSLWPIGRYA